MGSIHPTDFIIYDFNKKKLLFEGLFQCLHDLSKPFLYYPIPNSSTSKIRVEKAGMPAQAFEPYPNS